MEFVVEVREWCQFVLFGLAVLALQVIATRHRLIARSTQELGALVRTIRAGFESVDKALRDLRADVRNLPNREAALADAIKEFSEASISEPARALQKWITTEGERHTSALRVRNEEQEMKRELLKRWQSQVESLMTENDRLKQAYEQQGQVLKSLCGPQAAFVSGHDDGSADTGNSDPSA